MYMTIKNQHSKYTLDNEIGYQNVDGAPFHIGERVVVLNNPNKDETFDEHFAFKSGVMIYFDYECGCG
ncbi:MAG: hypothetical protein U5J96_11090 [Ignavibacteriaceae bacterium]|nr:hypothetical protein [Ignavibacteriaceae bacterium]